MATPQHTNTLLVNWSRMVRSYINRLAREPEKVFEAASSGSDPAMAALLSQLHTFTTNHLESLTFSMHDYLLIHAGRPICKTHMDCVEALAYLAERLYKLSGEAHATFFSMSSTVIPLMSLVYGVCRNVGGCSATGGFARACPDIICAYLDKVVIDDPLAIDIFGLAITMWLKDKSPYSRTETSATSLSLMLSRYKVANARKRRHILKSIIPEPRRAANRILQRLIDIICGEGTVFGHLCLQLHVVGLFIEDRTTAICLIQKDIVGILRLVLIRLTVSPCGPDHHKCISLLMQTFDTVFSWSLRTFNAALGQDMLETTAWLYYRMLDQPCDDEVSHGSSIYRTFIEIFSKYLNSEISITEMFGARRRLMNSPVYDLFTQYPKLGPCAQLDDFLLSRGINIRLFSFLESNVPRKCDNPSCDRNNLRSRLLECANCEEVVYCDRRCQAQHWISYGHMYDCRAMSKFKKESKLSTRDRGFLVHLATTEVRRHFFSLEQLARQTFPSLRTKFIGYDVDLTNETLPVGSLGVHNVLQPDDLQLHSREDYAQAKIHALSQDRNLLYLRIKVDECRGVRTLHAQTSLRMRDVDLPSSDDDIIAPRQSCSDISGNPLDARVDVVDWLIRDVRRAAEEMDGTNLWDEAFIDSRIRLLEKRHLDL